MIVVDSCEVLARPPHSRFSFVESPFYVATDRPYESGTAMWGDNSANNGDGPDRAGFVADAALQCIYPAPIYVPHHNCVSIFPGECSNYPGVDPATVNVAFPAVWSWGIGPDGVANYVSGGLPFYNPNKGVLIEGYSPVFLWTPTTNNTRSFGFEMNMVLETTEFNLPAIQNRAGYVQGVDVTGGYPTYGVPNDGNGLIPGTIFEVTADLAAHGMWFAFAGVMFQVPTDPDATYYLNRSWTARVGDPLSDPYLADGTQTANSYGAEVQFDVGVGSGSDRAIYRLKWLNGNDPVILRQYAGETEWKALSVVPVSAEAFKAFGPDGDFLVPTGGSVYDNINDPATKAPINITDPVVNRFSGIDHLKERYQRVEFRLIAGRLAVRVGNNATAYYFDEARVDSEGNAISTITYARMFANDWWKVLRISGHPARWTQSIQYDSPDIPIGFYSEAFDDPFVEAAGVVPEGWDAYVDQDNSLLTGPVCNYRLLMSGPLSFPGYYKGVPYSNLVAAVRVVDLIWESVEDFNPDAGWILAPEEIKQVSHELNPETLQIHSHGSLLLNNNKPTVTPRGIEEFYAQWALDTGQVALDIGLSRNIPGLVEGTWEWGPMVNVFSGYGNTQSGIDAQTGGEGHYEMFFQDRSRSLMTDKFLLPWFDGWNLFFLMAYLAQLGGVSLRDMAFANLVPDTPMGPNSDLGDGEGNGAYYMPVGAAGSALTRFSKAKLWELMGSLAFALGYMLFFDATGMLQFRKFRLPDGVKRNFWETDRDSAAYNGQGGGLEGCWSIGVFKNMDEVRSDAVTIGINAFAPEWDPIVFKQQDWNVIFNSNAFNHLGYGLASVWMESLFADPYFAYQANLEMFYFIRCPGLDVRFTTWLQPDIFPLDVVRVNSPRVGTYGTRLLVTGVSHHKDKAKATSSITARYVPPIPQVLQ